MWTHGGNKARGLWSDVTGGGGGAKAVATNKNNK
jgi:hypothetical protein